jgi:hypothetical protein
MMKSMSANTPATGVRVGFEKYNHVFLPDSFIDELKRAVAGRMAFYNKMMNDYNSSK